MPEWLKDWWPALALAIGIASPLIHTWINWSVNKRFASKDDLAAEGEKRNQAIDVERKSRHEREGELRQLLSDGMRRVDRIENDLAHLPSGDALTKMMVQMTRLEGRLDSFDERFDGFATLMTRMDRQLQVMDDFLRKVKTA